MSHLLASSNIQNSIVWKTLSTIKRIMDSQMSELLASIVPAHYTTRNLLAFETSPGFKQAMTFCSGGQQHEVVLSAWPNLSLNKQLILLLEITST